MTFAVIGDSLTAGDVPLQGDVVTGQRSWVPAAAQPPLVFLGGWAVPGATTSQMLVADVPPADVLVLLGGTNDLRDGIPWQSSRRNLLDLSAKGAGAAIVLVAVPPKDQQPSGVLELNQRLAALASEQGWDFVDPWEGDDERGSWASGDSVDGIHPTQAVADEAGRVIAAAIHSANSQR